MASLVYHVYFAVPLIENFTEDDVNGLSNVNLRCTGVNVSSAFALSKVLAIVHKCIYVRRRTTIMAVRARSNVEQSEI